MAWPGIPNTASIAAGPLSPATVSMDMKMYEMIEHLRTVQIVQAEQSRRLDDQAYRLHQLEARENNINARERLESQRYLWGPGAVGSVLGRPGTLGTPAIRMGIGLGGGTNGASGRGLNGLPGLGFEVFASSPQGREKNKEQGMEIQIAPDELHELNGHSEIVNGNGIPSLTIWVNDRWYKWRGHN